jgi:hypothetical protein
LTKGGVDHVLDDAVAPGEAGFRQLELQAILARHALQVLEQFPLDPPLGPGADAMDRAQEQVYQRIREFPLAEATEDGQQRQPQRRRVSPHFVGRFHGRSLPKALEDLGRGVVEESRRQTESADAVELGDRLQDARQAGRTGIGVQLGENGPAWLQVGLCSVGRSRSGE